MNAVFALRVRKIDGAVAHLASALTNHGLLYKGHDLYGCSPAHCRVDIRAEGTAHQLEGLQSRFSTLHEVIEVLEMDTTVEEEGAEPAATEDGQENAILNDIVWAYPRIRSLVAEYEDRLPPSECVHRLTKLGTRVGKRLGTGQAQLEQATTLDAALQTAVLPALHGVAAGESEGSGLRIVTNIFVRQNLDMMYLSVDKPRGCCFLTGLIQGMLNEAPRLPRLWATETQCREAGDAHCYFKIEQV